MDDKQDTPKAIKSRPEAKAKEARLKAALKANLQRRKAQARARKTDQAE